MVDIVNRHGKCQRANLAISSATSFHQTCHLLVERRLRLWIPDHSSQQYDKRESLYPWSSTRTFQESGKQSAPWYDHGGQSGKRKSNQIKIKIKFTISINNKLTAIKSQPQSEPCGWHNTREPGLF